MCTTAVHRVEEDILDKKTVVQKLNKRQKRDKNIQQQVFASNHVPNYNLLI